MKRVLILSNNCISQTNSNGRTIGNMFIGFPKEKIAQFTLTDSNPDFSVCANFFHVSDNDALNAFLKRKKVGRKLEKEALKRETVTVPFSAKHNRNSLTMFIRDFIWNTDCWKKGGFNTFVNQFSPEVILLQAGDCAFMFRLARKLSEKYKIPLIIYNSEGYFFKKFDYFKSTGIAHWLYPIFRTFFCMEFKKAMYKASFAIYSCKQLEEDYNKIFSTPSATIYTATQLEPCENNKDATNKQKVSYLGNLGVGRHQPLIEIANILQTISEDLYLEVYGKTANNEVLKALKNCKGIKYNGFISYDEVARVMHESALLVHIENFSDFYREDLKYAFSTKIADSLISGTPFLLYAPETLACTKYLKENNAAYIANDLKQLKKILFDFFGPSYERNQYIENAQKLVSLNHSQKNCSNKFQDIINRDY